MAVTIFFFPKYVAFLIYLIFLGEMCINKITKFLILIKTHNLNINIMTSHNI